MTPGSPYESPRLLGEYLLLHYGRQEALSHPSLPVDPAVTATPFPVRCVRELLDETLLPENASALEAGCSVGGAAFELARLCHRVEASDFSHSFITAAATLREQGRLATRITVEGGITAPFEAVVPADIDRGRVCFSVADATALPEHLVGFDVVLAANLLCRLPDPDSFLRRAHSLVKPGGQLLLTTPFTWLEEYTPRDRWIGGLEETHRSEDELRRRLGEGFLLHRRRDLPFLIREHERKYQLGIALGTSWIRQ
mgnify:CR=1 FL=1